MGKRAGCSSIWLKARRLRKLESAIQFVTLRLRHPGLYAWMSQSGNPSDSLGSGNSKEIASVLKKSAHVG